TGRSGAVCRESECIANSRWRVESRVRRGMPSGIRGGTAGSFGPILRLVRSVLRRVRENEMSQILEGLPTIKCPADLHRLSMAQLRQLADESRKRIIEVVGRNGGHLASNLGVAELTIALHYVFDFKHDRLLWDVGHQAYVHKLLTGRNERFDTLRKA